MFKHIKTINVKNKGEKSRISSETLTDFAYAEFSSAIEMLQAAKATDRKGLALGFVNHCLDEYRHTNFFLKVVKKLSGSTDFQPRFSISRGFLDTESFLFERLSLRDFSAFVAVNEKEAKKLFTRLQNDIGEIDRDEKYELDQIVVEETNHALSAQDTLSEFNSLLDDEQRHSELSFKYLRKIGSNRGNRYVVRKFFFGNKIRHFFARSSTPKRFVESFMMFCAITLIYPFSRVFIIKPLNSKELISKKTSSSML